MSRLHIPFIVLMAACTTEQQPTTDPLDSRFELQLETVEQDQLNHIRGLSMVTDEIAWASGAGGTFMKTIDGSAWNSDTIAGYTHLDFRDVHAFDGETAVLMVAGSEGRILRTEDGGNSWIEVYTNLDSGIFLDGIDFHDDSGYCYGDPMNGTMFVLKTVDQGRTWTEMKPEKIPETLPNEAGFAASGTGVITTQNQTWVATGGGEVARVFRSVSDEWGVFNTPIRSAEGCGIFSMAHISPSTLVAVGGCYLDSTSRVGNCAVSLDNGETWTSIGENGPRGYRSCVAYSQPMNLLVACGRTGIDISKDRGSTWETLSDEGFYVCALGDSTGWLMGRRGKSAKLSLMVERE